jgi:hypothetical protein
LAHKLSIGLLWFPGPRATAYINILKELDIAINVIVVMKNDKGNIKGLTQEAATNNYSAQYFDVDYSLQQYVEEFGVRIVATSATHINDLTLSEIIFTEHVQDWIFCVKENATFMCIQESSQILEEAHVSTTVFCMI